MPYEHIVAATDLSDLGDLAVDRGIEIARAEGARLTLLHVLPEVPAPSPLVPHYHDIEDDAARLRAMKEAAAAALQQRAAASDLTLAYEVRCGDAADEILAVDAQLRPDLIVLATHGRRGLARFVMGSVTVRVLENARADVLAVRRDRDEE